MFVAGILQDRHGHLEKLGVHICVLPKFAARVTQKKLCILLVRQAISGDMIGLERDGFLQRQSPLLNRLSWQTEHQIDVDVREPGCAQKMKRMLGLLCVVLAPKQFQQVVVPRLHAEADPVDSEFFEDRGFARGNASRIRFHCPLDQFRQVELLMKSAQEKFQLRDVERGGRAATEIKRFRRNREMCVLVEIAEYRFTKSPGLRAVEQILVKSAVRADTRAERNVNVEVANHDISLSVIPSGARNLS